jgi:Ca2+-binding RTX toxin-like protein
VITVSVAPGSGDARVVVHSSGGNDRVYLDVAPRVRRLEIVVRTGEGDDYVSSVRYSARTRGRGWLVKGGSGADTILGGSAADLLFGGPGRDALDAGPGNDLLDGGRGRDVCLGGAGRDETRSC